MKKLLALIFLMNLCFGAFGQSSVGSAENVRVDSVYSRRLHWVAPAVLITTGVITALNKDSDEFFLSNFEVREERNERFINFSNHLDDYIQHVPSATTFILSACSKNKCSG